MKKEKQISMSVLPLSMVLFPFHHRTSKLAMTIQFVHHPRYPSLYQRISSSVIDILLKIIIFIALIKVTVDVTA